MNLADRSPGLTLVLAAVIVYGTILVEIGMWMVASWTAMFATLALVVVLAVVVCRWLFTLLDEEEPFVAPVAAPAPAEAARPARSRAPRATALPA
jgi:uncharacterized membrane protein YqjE